MILSLFTITEANISSTKSAIGEIFTDFAPLLMLIVGIMVGVMVIGVIVSILKK